MKKGYQLVYKWYDIFKHAIFEPECYYKFNFQIDTCFIILTNLLQDERTVRGLPFVLRRRIASAPHRYGQC